MVTRPAIARNDLLEKIVHDRPERQSPTHHFCPEMPHEPVIHPRNPTRAVRIGSVVIGDSHPVAVQSMTATRTQDIDATVAQVQALAAAGADVVRIAADSTQDAAALAEIRRQCSANLSVDLQENYRLAELVAPHVHKIRYNPGHLYHHERDKPWQEKVRYLAAVAREHDCAIRIGVNCGSVDPALQEQIRSARLDFADARQRLGALRAAGFDRTSPATASR